MSIKVPLRKAYWAEESESSWGFCNCLMDDMGDASPAEVPDAQEALVHQNGAGRR